MKCRMNVRIRSGVLMLLVLFFMSGCGATVHKHLDPSFSQRALVVNVLSKVPKEEVCIHIDPKQYVSGGVGIVPILIDKAINKARASSCEEIVAPLLEATADVDFRSQYWEALEKTLAQSSWMKVKRLDKRSLGYDKEELQYMQTPMLILTTFYELSTHSEVLIVQTKANLYINNLSEPDYFGFYTYYSDKIGKNGEENEEAIALWTANNAAKFREVLAEGINHNMTMMRYDLLENPSGPDAEKKLEEIKFRLRGPFTGSKETLKGVVISRDTEYLLMREKGGNLFTIAQGLKL